MECTKDELRFKTVDLRGSPHLSTRRTGMGGGRQLRTDSPRTTKGPPRLEILNSLSSLPALRAKSCCGGLDSD